MRDDPDRLRIDRAIAGFATNPNVAATLLIGVGAEDEGLVDPHCCAGSEGRVIGDVASPRDDWHCDCLRAALPS